MATWTELLDDYEATILALEVALGSGDVPVEVRTWEPPVGAAASSPTDEERQRFGRLRVRAASCEAQLEAALEEAATDLQTARLTGVAARTYGRMGYLTGS